MRSASSLAVRITAIISLVLNKDPALPVVCSGGHGARTVARPELLLQRASDFSAGETSSLGDLLVRNMTPTQVKSVSCGLFSPFPQGLDLEQSLER